jgi:hypothetical protein
MFIGIGAASQRSIEQHHQQGNLCCTSKTTNTPIEAIRLDTGSNLHIKIDWLKSTSQERAKSTSGNFISTYTLRALQIRPKIFVPTHFGLDQT